MVGAKRLGVTTNVPLSVPIVLTPKFNANDNKWKSRKNPISIDGDPKQPLPLISSPSMLLQLTTSPSRFYIPTLALVEVGLRHR
uniref:Uncharacterized protein n=1 Tax=Cannabis sativa TaxID=3483 RepID=A0A803RBM6_CANSA